MKIGCTHPVSQNPPFTPSYSLFETRLIALDAGAYLPGSRRVMAYCGLTALHSWRVLNARPWRERINAHDARSMRPLIAVIRRAFVSGWLRDRVTGWMYADYAAAMGSIRGDHGGGL